MQAHLDRPLRIDPHPADGPVLNPWLGAHDPVISPWVCGSTLLVPLKRRTNRLDRTSTDDAALGRGQGASR
jgi:hypothetical protein